MSQIQAYTPHTVTDVVELRRLLDGVRADGYACVAQELEPGLQSVAVPIVDRSGRVIAAMNVSGHANRYTREAMLEAFLPPLRRAADQINHALLRAGRRGRDGERKAAGIMTGFRSAPRPAWCRRTRTASVR